ncbi:right-handed parallel beta-helix repeat-containing protein [Methanobacterium petrolearium]|uniref:right-handed parallel beta-helix repeat-containing protein n=1 Tax=Methanobacterium petrolearium TaxID=710190 RepID=UPI001AE9B8EE|nr:right-handed parallel beta-helix repeat-containing protein [Methanobacterium petrolearium]MBP1946662.1 parallel beta-helix repeat protein [Methanobacterium petrolearium]BDZ72111.1 hypothetical protein GCM10025861_26280 [Methanobacterium petrolearium]
MNKKYLYMIIVSIFLMIISFNGTVSAANLTVNPGSSIQAAVNNASNGDIIIVNDDNGSAYTYTENIIVNKTLNLQSNSSNVTIQAYDASKSVFTINSNGSGSTIKGFTITGGTSFTSSGIRLNSASNCTIQSNKITRNRIGLYISGLSTNNNIFNNYIQNNTGNGILLYSKNNTITGNNISNNYAGIWIYSRDNLISRNIVSNNRGFGIYIEGSNNNYLYGNIISNNNYGVYFFESNFEMHFNQIFGNQYGVYSDLAGFLNATNNWWGSNNPTVTSSNTPADIVIYDGTVTYDPWLVLNLSGAVIHVTHNNTSNSQITADITHNNHGQDTSGSGTIPDGLPVHFTTNLGTITPTGTTRRGQVTVTLTSSPSFGAATVTATLDGQTVSKAFRKSFSTIQTAVENTLTVDGDIILVENGTYTENIVVNKKLGIFSDGNVTVRSGTPSSPTFTINSSGSGSVIEGFIITQYTSSYGILLNSTNECYISNNILTLTGGIGLHNSHNNTLSGNILDDNSCGIYSTHSCNNTLYSNTVSRTVDNSGIILSYYSTDNTIIGNDIKDNGDAGIYITGHSSVQVKGNNFTNNTIRISNLSDVQIYNNNITSASTGTGISLSNFSSAEIHFNRITGNFSYGLMVWKSTVNATNNWWGTNNVIYSNSTIPSSCNIWNRNGTVIYDPWLVLTVNTSSVNSGGNASVTADLTHNNVGSDTSSEGHIPDDVPVNFTTTLGTVISPVYTFNGKATTILNLGTTQSVTVTVSASVDGQNVSKETTLSPGMAILNITSTALDPSRPYYELVGYQNITETKVFNWYKLAVILTDPCDQNVNALKNYVSRTYGDMRIIDCAIPPENVVEYLLYGNLYTDWWSEELLQEFVYCWGLSDDDFHYIQQNYLSWDVINYLYDCMWDDLGNCTVQQPPSNDRDDILWYSRIWSAGNAPYVRFPLMLPYVPPSWTHTSTTSIPIYHETYSPLNITCEIPLNESVTWVSVVWKANEFDRFTEEIDLIVNGQVVINKTVINAAYLANSHIVDPNSYDSDVFDDINNINYYLSDSTIPRTYLGAILNMTDSQLQNFTKSQLGELLISRYTNVFQYNATESAMLNHYESFTDDLIISLSYPGDEGKKITVVDPDTNSTTLINLPGSYTQRMSDLIYHNGAYAYETINNTNWYEGYDGVRSFAIATTRVSDDILRYWLNQKDNYNLTTNYTYTEGNMTYLFGQGPMKAAYGTFLTSLLVEYCHDKTADAAASKYNVTWSRTVPVVVSVVDDANVCYVTGESDHRMGMDVIGNPANARAFRYACSSAFSPIEYWVFTALGFGDDPRGSVTLGLGDILIDGEPLVIFENDGYTIIKRAGDNSMFLIIDPVTGIVRDCASPLDICGNFCYNDPQTELAYDWGESLWAHNTTIKDILENNNGTIDFSGMADNVKEGLTGFMSSAMMSLESAAMFLVNNPSILLLNPIIGTNMVGLIATNIFLAKTISENSGNIFQFVSTHQDTLPGDIAYTTTTGISAYGIYGLIFSGSVVAGPFGASIGFMVGSGSLLLSLRTNYFPLDYWQYFNVHRSWVQGYEHRCFVGSDNHVYHVETPRNPDGSLRENESVIYDQGYLMVP